MSLFFFLLRTCIYADIAYVWKMFKTFYPTYNCMLGSIIDAGITSVLFANFDNEFWKHDVYISCIQC